MILFSINTQYFNVVVRLNVTTFPSYHILCQKKYDRKEEEERKCKSLKNRGKMIKDKK